MTRKLLSKNKTKQLRKLSSGLVVMGPFAHIIKRHRTPDSESPAGSRLAPPQVARGYLAAGSRHLRLHVAIWGHWHETRRVLLV